MAKPFLSSLGIGPFEQAREPSSSVYPKTFNPHNKDMWMEAVHGLEPSGDNQADWAQCIARYIQICEKRGVFPFQNTHQARNDQISDFLLNRREDWVRFVDRVDFFNVIDVRKDSKITVTMNDSGFRINSEFPTEVKDPTFEAWLKKAPVPGFSLTHYNDRHTKDLGNGLSMYAERENSKKWNIGFEIVCRVFPDLPANHTPSRAELERFVRDVLWKPHQKALRPKLRTRHSV